MFDAYGFSVVRVGILMSKRFLTLFVTFYHRVSTDLATVMKGVNENLIDGWMNE